MLVDAFSTLENLCLGHEPVGRFGALDENQARRQAQAVMSKLDLDLDLQSAPGQGTTIDFSLAFAAPAVARDTRQKSDLIGARLTFGAGKRALIVDADALALDAMLALME